MKKSEAMKLRPGDHVLIIGLDEVREAVIETVSEYGNVNVHDIDNQGHFYRTYDEFFPLLDEPISIGEMFYKQLNKQNLERSQETYEHLEELREDIKKLMGDMTLLNIFTTQVKLKEIIEKSYNKPWVSNE